MQARNFLIAAIAPLITLLPQLTLIATAQVRSSCNVPIVGRERGSRVNMRAGAGTDFESPGYVLVGQLVNMLNDAEGNRIRRRDSVGADFWYLVEYVPSQTRGWVREDFIGPSCVR